MKIIVGLGNPGRKYEATRHNIGFEVVYELARRHATGGVRKQFDSESVEAQIGMQKCLLLCPQTYMNRSGRSVTRARDFYKLELDEILVICDDFNLDLGRLRTRRKGSAGGQKGLADIIRCLGSDEFARLRVGIGHPPPQWDVADFVLSKFNKDERDAIVAAVNRAANAVEDWVKEGVDYCMNHYNAGGG